MREADRITAEELNTTGAAEQHPERRDLTNAREKQPLLKRRGITDIQEKGHPE